MKLNQRVSTQPSSYVTIQSWMRYVLEEHRINKTNYLNKSWCPSASSSKWSTSFTVTKSAFFLEPTDSEPLQVCPLWGMWQKIHLEDQRNFQEPILTRMPLSTCLWLRSGLLDESCINPVWLWTLLQSLLPFWNLLSRSSWEELYCAYIEMCLACLKLRFIKLGWAIEWTRPLCCNSHSRDQIDLQARHLAKKFHSPSLLFVLVNSLNKQNTVPYGSSPIIKNFMGISTELLYSTLVYHMNTSSNPKSLTSDLTPCQCDWQVTKKWPKSWDPC